MTNQYYEALAEIPQDHCLHIQLPPEIPTGLVRVAIIYDPEPKKTNVDIKHLLATMPDVGDDADFSRRYDEEVQA